MAPCALPVTLFLPRLMSKAAIKEVKTKFFHHGSAEVPFVFASGETLPGITVAYETYGKLNAGERQEVQEIRKWEKRKGC